MKIKHKVQRKLDPTFQAELKLCSLCGPTTWWQWVVCAGSRDGPWRWFLGAHLPGRCNCGVRGRVGVSASGLQWAALCCSLRLSWWRDVGGDAGSSGSGAEHPDPQSAGASTEKPPSPWVSAASLRILCSLYPVSYTHLTLPTTCRGCRSRWSPYH